MRAVVARLWGAHYIADSRGWPGTLNTRGIPGNSAIVRRARLHLAQTVLFLTAASIPAQTDFTRHFLYLSGLPGILVLRDPRFHRVAMTQTVDELAQRPAFGRPSTASPRKATAPPDPEPHSEQSRPKFEGYGTVCAPSERVWGVRTITLYKSRQGTQG